MINRLYKRVLHFSTGDRLLGLFFICILLMVALSFVAGPDPRLKVFVLASQQTTEEISGIAKNISQDIVIFTLEDEPNEFSTLVIVNFVDCVVIGDFRSPDTNLAYYIYGGLDRLPRGMILVLSEYAKSGLGFDVQKRYQDGVVKVISKGEVQQVLMSLSYLKAHHAFFWKFCRVLLPFNLFSVLVSIIALLSLLLLSIVTAIILIASIENRPNATLRVVSEVVVMSVFLFVLSQAIYFICSRLVHMPIFLHANFSSKHVTAVSFLGQFGGSSYLRMLFASGGYLFGGVITFKKFATRLKSRSALIMVSLLAVASSLVYLFGTNYNKLPAFSYINWLVNLSFAIFEAYEPVDISLTASRSIAMYFAGSLCTVLLPRSKRITGSILFITCLVLISRGIVGIGNLLPIQTYVTIIPGFTLGGFLLIIFKIVNMVEGSIKFRQRRSTG